MYNLYAAKNDSISITSAAALPARAASEDTALERYRASQRQMESARPTSAMTTSLPTGRAYGIAFVTTAALGTIFSLIASAACRSGPHRSAPC
jgi:hypothetical protein